MELFCQLWFVEFCIIRCLDICTLPVFTRVPTHQTQLTSVVKDCPISLSWQILKKYWGSILSHSCAGEHNQKCLVHRCNYCTLICKWQKACLQRPSSSFVSHPDQPHHVFDETVHLWTLKRSCLALNRKERERKGEKGKREKSRWKKVKRKREREREDRKKECRYFSKCPSHSLYSVIVSHPFLVVFLRVIGGSETNPSMQGCLSIVSTVQCLPGNRWSL